MITIRANLQIIAILALPLSQVIPTLGVFQVHAQITHQTCMDMGGGMITCNGMVHGGNATTSSGSGQSSGDSGTVLGSALGRLIFGDPEQRFRREVGRMLADGRCADAANFALREGRLELGSQIARSCTQAAPTTNSAIGATEAPKVKPTATPQRLENLPAPEVSIEDRIQEMVRSANTPMRLDEITNIESVAAIERQLIFYASHNSSEGSIRSETRANFINSVCADSSIPNLFRLGVSIRLIARDMNNAEIGSVMVDRQTCGF